MLIPDLLREVRRRHALSIRTAAEACDVPRATWASWESGTSSPSAQRLDEVLAVLDLELRLGPRPVEPPGEAAARRFLRQSLTTRAHAALGEQVDAVLAACRSEPRLLTGPAAVGVWVRHVVARGPLPLPRPREQRGLVRVCLDVGLAGDAWVLVPTPGALVAEGAAAQWPGLLTSARLLSEERPRDSAGRRLPAHRDPAESREILDLAHTLTWGGRGRMPISETDSRAWRLGAPATLDAALARSGLPPRHGDRCGPRQAG